MCAHRPVLAEAELVSGPAESIRENLHLPSSLVEVVEITQVRCVPSSPTGSQSSCLEVVQASLEGRGFSQEALKRVMTPQAPSTLKLYQGKWSLCESQHVDPFQADFLPTYFMRRNCLSNP